MAALGTPLTFGTETTDKYETVNVVRMRAERAERARSIMRKHGVAALLVAGTQNVRYLTGFWHIEFQRNLSYALFFVDHDPIVFAHAGSYQHGPYQQPWIKEWRIGRSWMGGLPGRDASLEEAKKFAREIAAELRARGLDGEALGVVDFDEMALEALKGERITTRDAATLLLEASAVKTQDEIRCSKMAATIATAGFQRALEVIRPGITEAAILASIRQAMAAVGAEEANGFIWSGPHGFARGVSGGNRIVEHGDIVQVAPCTTSFLGYQCCLYRSFIVGTPTPKQNGWYDAVRDRLDAVMSELRPGRTTADAAKHFPPASKWGYKDEAEVLTVEFGHGMGLVNIANHFGANYNHPVINRLWSLDHPQELVPGMIVAVETLEGEHRVGGARLEDMVLITESGPERFDSFPRDQLLKV